MPTSAQSVGQRLRHVSTKTRVESEEEPSPKRARLDMPSYSPLSSQIKGTLKQSEDDNLVPLVAKSFYGLKKSQPTEADKIKSGVARSSGISAPRTKVFTGNGKAMCPKSHLDALMMERVALSPVKQAVLQTCSLVEFRKVYRDEYEELEEEMKSQNSRTTRQTSQIRNKKNEQRLELSLCSDSSDDEVSFRLSDRDLNCRTKDQASPEMVAESVSVIYKNKALNEKCIAPRRNQHRTKIRDKPTVVDGNMSDTEDTIHQGESRKHDAPMSSVIPTDKESDDQNTHYKKNSQVHNRDSDSSQQLSTPSSSERRFFKTRSPLESAKKGGIMLGKGFSLKFRPKTLKTEDKKKKLALQKRQTKSVSQKTTQTSVASNLHCSVKPVSPISGFTSLPGFLSLDESGSDNLEEDEYFDLNRSTCCTYGSVTPEHRTAQNCNDSQLPCESNTTGPLSENSSPPSETSQADIAARKNGLENHISSKEDGDTSQTKENICLSATSHKLFSIFERKSGQFGVSNKKKSSCASPASNSSKLPKDSNNSQMIIDAGQKKFGVTHCPVCSMVYSHADPIDEAAHAKFHKRLIEVLKFPGWKKERVVQEYPEDLGRVILVLPDDAKYAKRKVEEVCQLMGRELGFPDATSSLLHPYHKVFFYVEDKQITGCVVAESVQEGHRIIPGDLDNSQESGQRPWCCAPTPESVCVGISRLWVTAERRKHGVATKIVDCVRQWFNYGSLIPKHKVAFSDPTPDGRRFAHKYMGTPTFLVYKFSYG